MPNQGCYVRCSARCVAAMAKSASEEEAPQSYAPLDLEPISAEEPGEEAAADGDGGAASAASSSTAASGGGGGGGGGGVFARIFEGAAAASLAVDEVGVKSFRADLGAYLLSVGEETDGRYYSAPLRQQKSGKRLLFGKEAPSASGTPLVKALVKAGKARKLRPEQTEALLQKAIADGLLQRVTLPTPPAAEPSAAELSAGEPAASEASAAEPAAGSAEPAPPPAAVGAAAEREAEPAAEVVDVDMREEGTLPPGLPLALGAPTDHAALVSLLSALVKTYALSKTKLADVLGLKSCGSFYVWLKKGAQSAEMQKSIDSRVASLLCDGSRLAELIKGKQASAAKPAAAESIERKTVAAEEEEDEADDGASVEELLVRLAAARAACGTAADVDPLYVASEAFGAELRAAAAAEAAAEAEAFRRLVERTRAPLVKTLRRQLKRENGAQRQLKLPEMSLSLARATDWRSAMCCPQGYDCSAKGGSHICFLFPSSEERAMAAYLPQISPRSPPDLPRSPHRSARWPPTSSPTSTMRDRSPRSLNTYPVSQLALERTRIQLYMAVFQCIPMCALHLPPSSSRGALKTLH